jgi:hypothetical protein
MPGAGSAYADFRVADEFRCDWGRRVNHLKLSAGTLKIIYDLTLQSIFSHSTTGRNEVVSKSASVCGHRLGVNGLFIST